LLIAANNTIYTEQRRLQLARRVALYEMSAALKGTLDAATKQAASIVWLTTQSATFCRLTFNSLWTSRAKVAENSTTEKSPPLGNRHCHDYELRPLFHHFRQWFWKF